MPINLNAMNLANQYKSAANQQNQQNILDGQQSLASVYRAPTQYQNAQSLLDNIPKQYLPWQQANIKMAHMIFDKDISSAYQPIDPSKQSSGGGK